MHIETLEPRLAFAADLTFTDFALSGSPLFEPGKTSTVVARLRNLGNSAPASYSVTFKAIDVGFSSNTDVSYSATGTEINPTFTAVPITLDARGTSITFSLKFPTNFVAGRYALIGKITADGDTLTSNDTRLIAVGRSLPRDGNLIVAGTSAGDLITLASAKSGTRVNVAVNDYTESFATDRITAFTVRAAGGDDAVVVIGNVPRVSLDGGDGDDKLVGGDGADTLAGRAGSDTLYGGFGNDRLDGDGGHDRLYGQEGVDRLYGGNGNDSLDAGAASDRLDGGAGVDTLFGQGGNDRFFTRDNAIDQLFGGSGDDTATADLIDVLGSIARNS